MELDSSIVVLIARAGAFKFVQFEKKGVPVPFWEIECQVGCVSNQPDQRVVPEPCISRTVADKRRALLARCGYGNHCSTPKRARSGESSDMLKYRHSTCELALRFRAHPYVRHSRPPRPFTIVIA